MEEEFIVPLESYAIRQAWSQVSLYTWYQYPLIGATTLRLRQPFSPLIRRQ